MRQKLPKDQGQVGQVAGAGEAAPPGPPRPAAQGGQAEAAPRDGGGRAGLPAAGQLDQHLHSGGHHSPGHQHEFPGHQELGPQRNQGQAAAVYAPPGARGPAAQAQGAGDHHRRRGGVRQRNQHQRPDRAEEPRGGGGGGGRGSAGAQGPASATSAAESVRGRGDVRGLRRAALRDQADVRGGPGHRHQHVVQERPGELGGPRQTVRLSPRSWKCKGPLRLSGAANLC